MRSIVGHQPLAPPAYSEAARATDHQFERSMRAEFVNPFLQAASEVLESELGSEPTRGAIGLKRSAYTTEEVTAVSEVSGSIAGLVLYGMPEKTAREIVQKMMGSPCEEFDALAQSGISELGNVITSRAMTLLSEAGFASTLTPPLLVLGRGRMVSKVDQQRLVIPLETALGPITIQVVLGIR
jgi:chemotaxis protein CheX